MSLRPGLGQYLKLTQQLRMTPQLQQAIKLLQLSRVELQDLVRGELLENPMLEDDRETGSSGDDPVSSIEMQDGVELQHDATSSDNQTTTEVTDPAAQEVKPEPAQEQASSEGVDWDAYFEDRALASSSPGSGVRQDEELPGVEQTLTEQTSLFEHIMWQVRLSDFSAAEEQIAEYIARNVSPGGYLLGVSSYQIARQLGRSVLEVEQVLRRVQGLDPFSVASRTLAEALWIQCDQPDAKIGDPLVRTIIARHLEDIEKRAFPVIARETGELLEEVYEATKTIQSLEPRPARAFATEQAQYVTPDVSIQKVAGEYVVTLNEDGLPKLRISRENAAFYRTLGQGSASKEKEYVTERLRSAEWLMKSLLNRQRTILKVAKSILNFQREFFEKGPQYLKPLILKDVADDIEMHESTVSRVTTNKYVHTPQGIFELKYFFNAGISRHGGDELASEAVKHRISTLIGNEDPSKPLSDQKLVNILADEGINIARRTVAKYREQLNLLSSSKRRKLF